MLCQLVLVAQVLQFVCVRQVDRLLVAKVDSPVHVADEELAVLLSLRLVGGGQEGLCSLCVALLQIVKAVLHLLLARGKVAVKKHKARVFVVKADGRGALVGRHTAHASLHFDGVHLAETLDVVFSSEEHNKAPEHYLPRDAAE